MAYTKTNWVNNTTPLNATNMNKIEEGIAAVDAAITAVKNGYLPLTGGTLTGRVYINENFFAKKNVDINGMLTCDGKLIANDGIECNSGVYIGGGVSIGDTLSVSTFYGENISLNAIDSSEHLNINTNSISYENVDNPASWTLSGISDSTGTSSTIAASLKCLADNYLPLSGGTVSGAMTVVGGITTQKMTTDALSVTDAGGKISVTGSKLNFGQNNGTITSTLTGISDSTGTSSTVAVSQKCLNDNYLPLSGGTMTGNLKVNSGVYVKNNFYVCKDDVTPSVVSGMVYTEWDSSSFIFSVRKADDGVTISAENGGTVTFGCGAVKSRLTGISDSTGTSSTIATSQKCLSDNYIAKTSAAVSAAINLLPTGTSAPVDADYYVCQSVGGGTTDTTYYRRPMSYLWSYINGKLGSSYLPISGGTITGDTTVMGSTGQYGIKFTNGDIQFLSDGGATVGGTITGISSSKGTSTTRAMSEKGVADNYIAKTDISDTTGQSTTKVPSLKCLLEHYASLTGAEFTGDITIEGGDGHTVYSPIDITLVNYNNADTLNISPNNLSFHGSGGNWTFAGTVFSTTDLTAGTSALPDNQLYFVYE